MIAVNVARAAGTTGFRNACTPLLTASTPVKAVHPEANAFSRIQTPTTRRDGASPGSAAPNDTTATGCPPDATTL